YGIAPLVDRLAPATPAHSEHDHDTCSGDHGHAHDPSQASHDHGETTLAATTGARPPLDLHGQGVGEDDGAWWQSKKARLTLGAGAAIVVAFIVSHLFPDTKPIAFALAMLVGLIPIAR